MQVGSLIAELSFLIVNGNTALFMILLWSNFRSAYGILRAKKKRRKTDIFHEYYIHKSNQNAQLSRAFLLHLWCQFGRHAKVPEVVERIASQSMLNALLRNGALAMLLTMTRAANRFDK